MATEEIGFAELRSLIGRSWKSILALAGLSGVIALAVLWFAVPVQYLSTATLVVQPPINDGDGGTRPAVLYASLAKSDTVLGRTTERLRTEEVLREGQALEFNKDIMIEVRTSGRDRAGESFVLALIAKARDREKAARTANTWAQVFVEETRLMLQSTAPQSAALLEEQRLPTRRQLEELRSERSRVRDEFRQREEKTSTSWDQRISLARERAGQAIADYQTKTRRSMEEAVMRHLPSQQENTMAALRSKLFEIVSVHAQLAQTPRVLSLEKAASDETLAELIAKGGDAELFDSTLVSQEVNPLYDQLAVRVLELESELKAVAEDSGPIDVSPILALLETLQRERAAGLAVLSEAKSQEVRTLRRRRGRELEKLTWEQADAMEQLSSQIEQLSDLESRLSQRLNQSVVSGLLQEVDLTSVAAPAVPIPLAEPRGLPLRVTLAVFLGGLLGLMIALFRSAGE